jgi:type VI protein secretion system component Hcp
MSRVCYFKIDGYDGSCAVKGYEKFTTIYHFDFQSFFDFNPNSAQKAGDQKMKPIRLVCKLEETAPEWLQVFRKGTELKGEVRLPVMDGPDKDPAYMSIKLENCLISGWQLQQPPSGEKPTENSPDQMGRVKVRPPWFTDPGAKGAEIASVCVIELTCTKFTIEHPKYTGLGNFAHRKTQDTFDFHNPTG